MNITIKSYRTQIEKGIKSDLEKGMERVGLIVERQAKINVTKSPPEHPQVRTGRLRSSIIHQINKTGNEIIAEIGTNVLYGKYLELGTINHSPYPWLFPAVEMNRNKIADILRGKFTAA